MIKVTVFIALLGIAALLLQAANNEVSAGNAEAPASLQMLKYEAQDNNANAQLLYGLAYLKGEYGLKPDAKKAVYWLRRAARFGNAYAQLVLGECFANGNGVTKNTKQAFKWWLESAAKGNAQAQFLAGKAYLNGTGTKKNPQQAINWLTRSASQNDKDAQYLLGKLYYEGVDVPQDRTMAEDWLNRSAGQGKTDAINLLAILKKTVDFTTTVYKESAKSLIERAEKRDPQAEFELGLRYESGAWDVDQDNARALIWITRSAEDGNRVAMHTLADIYRHGDLGLKVDLVKADKWAKKAAKTSP